MRRIPRRVFKCLYEGLYIWMYMRTSRRFCSLVYTYISSPLISWCAVAACVLVPLWACVLCVAYGLYLSHHEVRRAQQALGRVRLTVHGFQVYANHSYPHSHAVWIYTVY